MTTNLPAYLQQSPAKKLNETALLGIGAALPPHISIRGNTFTLVDASGAEQVAGPTLDVCVADISDVVCKQYYSEKWTPDSNEPPICWSANGLAPSRESIEPQSATCADCRWNVRGSAVSALSGAAIKACRDERWLAVLIPSIPHIKFQLKLTPGSFKTWQSFVKLCEGNQTEINNVLTRITFQPGVNGVLVFQAISYIDENTAKMRNAGYAEKAFDALVGRTDKPIQAALPAPSAPLAAALPPQGQPAPFVAPLAATPTPPPTAATAASPSDVAAPTRRKRRTAAEMAAASGGPTAGAPVAPFRPQAPQAEQLPQATNPGFLGAGQQAPANPAFAAPPPAAAPANGGQQFGIAPGVAPNAEITQALDGLFGKK